MEEPLQRQISAESCQTREDNFKEDYTDICEKIKQVSKDAETNIKVDNTLDTEYATVKNSVDSLYTILTVGDPTTAAKAFIEQLEAEKSKLENQVAEDIATALRRVNPMNNMEPYMAYCKPSKCRWLRSAQVVSRATWML